MHPRARLRQHEVGCIRVHDGNTDVVHGLCRGPYCLKQGWLEAVIPLMIQALVAWFNSEFLWVETLEILDFFHLNHHCSHNILPPPRAQSHR